MSKTVIYLRIFTFLECEEKMKKITQILNFLNHNDFTVILTNVYYNAIRSENVPEVQDQPSLTIDMRDDKFRFKFWDGSKIYWTYHLEDLFNILIDGRREFLALVNKYQPVLDVLLKFKEENKYIKNVRYKYYPSSDIDIEYDIHFIEDAKDLNVVDPTLKEIVDDINDLNLEDLKMDLNYSFQKECKPCQKAKEKQK